MKFFEKERDETQILNFTKNTVALNVDERVSLNVKIHNESLVGPVKLFCMK